MPKINVYLPDELAEAVKAAGVPVSAVCQRALENAVRRVTAIRETVLGDLDADEPTGALAHFTPKARAVLAIAIDRAREAGAPRMATEHLLAAMLEEGTNLAIHVLRAMEIGPRDVTRDLSRQRPDPRDPAPEDAEDADPRRFDGPAAAALELAVTEATSLGHNYVGCEHLLLGLATEPEGMAGAILRGLGAEPRLVRRAVTAALAGYVHLRAQFQQGDKPGQQSPQGSEALAAIIRREVAPLGERIARLEEHLGLGLTDAHD